MSQITQAISLVPQNPLVRTPAGFATRTSPGSRILGRSGGRGGRIYPPGVPAPLLTCDDATTAATLTGAYPQVGIPHTPIPPSAYPYPYPPGVPHIPNGVPPTYPPYPRG